MTKTHLTIGVIPIAKWGFGPVFTDGWVYPYIANELKPPSTTATVPVTKAEASEMRY